MEMQLVGYPQTAGAHSRLCLIAGFVHTLVRDPDMQCPGDPDEQQPTLLSIAAMRVSNSRCSALSLSASSSRALMLASWPLSSSLSALRCSSVASLAAMRDCSNHHQQQQHRVQQQ